MCSSIETPRIIEAPLSRGEELGELVLWLGDESVFRAPLVVLNDEPESGFLSRFGDFVYLFFRELLEDG